MVVTAQKREEKLSGVSISLQVIHSEVSSTTDVLQVQALCELKLNFQLADQGADFQARATILGVRVLTPIIDLPRLLFSL